MLTFLSAVFFIFTNSINDADLVGIWDFDHAIVKYSIAGERQSSDSPLFIFQKLELNTDHSFVMHTAKNDSKYNGTWSLSKNGKKIQFEYHDQDINQKPLSIRINNEAQLVITCTMELKDMGEPKLDMPKVKTYENNALGYFNKIE